MIVPRESLLMHAVAWVIKFGVAPIGFGFALGAILATRCW